MYKVLIFLLAMVLLLAACTGKPAETTVETTTQPTHQPGLNTTPSDFVGFDDSTDPTNGTTESTETTEPTEFPVPPETKPEETKPTDPKPTESQPTEPDATVPNGVSIAPNAEGFIQYRGMTPTEQYAFFKEFGGDPVAFDAWLDTAEAAFKEKYPDVEYDGSGPIILPGT